MKPVCYSTVLVIFLVLGCTHKLKEDKPVPADLIPKEEMIDIFVDLKLMDAILATKQRNKDQDQHYTKYYLYNSVMEKYGITRDRFERSIEYYQRDLKVMDKIYEEAITKLSKMKNEEVKSD